jgi:hypothetical protein
VKQPSTGTRNAFRTAFYVFAFQCAAIITTVAWRWFQLNWNDFAGPIVLEASDLALKSRTSVIQPVGLVALVIVLLIKGFRQGWNEIKGHWKKHILESLMPAVGAVLVFFAYYLFFAVPARIRDEAKAVVIPFPNSPRVYTEMTGGSNMAPQQHQPVAFFYLDVDIKPGTSANYPVQLVAVNSTRRDIAPANAVVKDGSGTLWFRTPGSAPGTTWVDRELKDIHTRIELGPVKVGSAPVLFGVCPGVYRIELRVGAETLVERLQILFRNARWIRVIEVSDNRTVLFATPKPSEQPDLALSVFNATKLTLDLRNISDHLLREPYCQLVLWNVARAHLKDEPRVWRWPNRDAWIRPNESLTIPVGVGRTDDPLYGYAIVTCPECVATKASYIYFRAEEGWYQELPLGSYPWAVDQQMKGRDDDKLYEYFISGLSPTRPILWGERPRIPIRERPLY